MIYVASPYTHPRREIRQKRFEEVCAYVAGLIRAGYQAISPIVHSHPIACLHDLPGDAAFWKEWNRDLLRGCDALHILQLEGWQHSTGIKNEIEWAHDWGIDVLYVEP